MSNKRIAWFLSVLMLVSVCAGAAQAAGKATVTQEAFYVRPYIDYHAGEIYAEITNTGDKPVIFNGGLIELYNEDGDAIESDNLYRCYPEVLAPGEVGYLYNTTSVQEAVEPDYIDDYALTVTGKSENEKMTVRLVSEGSFGEYQRSKYYSEYAMFANVINDTDEILRGVRVVYALYDGEDKLLYADSTELYSLGIPPNQMVEVRMSVDSRMLEAWEKEDVKPERIVTIAYVEKEM